MSRRVGEKTAKAATQKASKANTEKHAAQRETASRKKKAAPLSPGGEEARASTKKAIILELLRRKQGAALSEIGKATGWQHHTIRGFISGNVTKKMGLTVESSKSEAGGRIYRIVE